MLARVDIKKKHRLEHFMQTMHDLVKLQFSAKFFYEQSNYMNILHFFGSIDYFDNILNIALKGSDFINKFLGHLFFSKNPNPMMQTSVSG